MKKQNRSNKIDSYIKGGRNNQVRSNIELNTLRELCMYVCTLLLVENHEIVRVAEKGVNLRSIEDYNIVILINKIS